MKKIIFKYIYLTHLLLFFSFCFSFTFSKAQSTKTNKNQTLNPDSSQKSSAISSEILHKIENEIVELSKNEQFIKLILEYQKNPYKVSQEMNNEKWKTFSVDDSVIVYFKTNPVAEFIKQNLKPYVAEVFISNPDGTKIAFLEKTSSWSHKNKPKHEVPMNNQVWIGPVEFDESSGVNQIQLSVPIHSKNKKTPIAVMVVGVAIARL